MKKIKEWFLSWYYLWVLARAVKKEDYDEFMRVNAILEEMLEVQHVK